MSETTVGSIVGFLRLDATQFHEEMDQAIAEVDRLNGKDVHVNVKAETARAEAGLAAVAAEEEKVDRGNAKIAKSGNDAGKGLGAMVTAAIALGPAIVPLAVGAAGLAAGYAGMGAAGVLALVGIKQEMAAGTTVGRAYTAQVNTLDGDLHTLARTAATGVLAPFQATVKSLQHDMPTLNSMTGELSVVTGKTAANIATGLVGGLVILRPLMQDVSMYTLGLSQRFEHLMTGPGLVSFGSYVRSVLPQVELTVESLVGAAVHLVAALAPLGGGTLAEIKMLSDVIGGIPVEVLTLLASGATSAYLGFKSYSLISGWVNGLGRALQFLGATEETAAAGMVALNVAAGAIGAVVAVATLLYSQHANAVQQDQQAIDSYTSALRESNGAIDENVRLTAFKQLQDDGAIAAAKTLGINLALVTDALLGNSGAAREVAKEMAAASAAQHQWSAGGATTGKNAAAVDSAVQSLSQSLGTNTRQFQTAQQNQKDWAAATATSTATASAQDVALQSLATAGGVTTSALQAATTAQQQQRDAAANAAASMFVENDAAGILKQSLDALNGKALSAADAQNAFDSSLANMGDHIDATGKKIHFTTTNIGNMSAASVALRGQLNAQVADLERVVEANGGLSNSTGKAREQMKTMRQQIIDNAVAHGVDRKAVTDYIDKLLQIPKKIPPTKLDVDTAAALRKLGVMQSAINSITGKTVSIYTNQYINTVSTATANAARTANQYAQGNSYGGGSTSIATGHKPAASANGNIFRAFADGGFEAHIAQIAPAGAMRLWAEPETGGEAYIPLAPSKRARSKAIWEETGHLLGADSGGPVSLDDATIAKLARAMAGVVMRPVVSAGSVDRAMGGALR